MGRIGSGVRISVSFRKKIAAGFRLTTAKKVGVVRGGGGGFDLLPTTSDGQPRVSNSRDHSDRRRASTWSASEPCCHGLR